MQQFLFIKNFKRVIKNPRISVGTSCNKHSVCLSFIQNFPCIFSAHNITRGNNWNVNGFYNTLDTFPIGLAFIELLSKATMNRKSRCASILQSSCKLSSSFVLHVIATPNFTSNWHSNFAQTRTNKSTGTMRIAHKRASLSSFSNLGNWARHIYVNTA